MNVLWGSRVRIRLAAALSLTVITCLGAGAAGAQPVAAALGAHRPGAELVVVGGTDDPTSRGLWNALRHNYPPSVNPQLISAPAAFGIGIDGLVVLPFIRTGPESLTYNHSADIGARAVEASIMTAPFPPTVVGFSQGATSAYDGSYRAQRLGSGPSSVVLLGDPRHRQTGLETVAPSVVPGVLTNGPMSPAATPGTPVTAVCIVGDPICGVNPYSVNSWFYAIPGYLAVHGTQYPHVAQMPVVATHVDDNVTYIAVDSGVNPWGLYARQNGVDVPPVADAVLTYVLPVDVPGGDIGGSSPRQIQQVVYRVAGQEVPVTSPDQVDAPTPAPTSVDVPAPQLTSPLLPKAEEPLPVVPPVPVPEPAAPAPATPTPTTPTPAVPAPAVPAPAVPDHAVPEPVIPELSIPEGVVPAPVSPSSTTSDSPPDSADSQPAVGRNLDDSADTGTANTQTFQPMG